LHLTFETFIGELEDLFGVEVWKLGGDLLLVEEEVRLISRRELLRLLDEGVLAAG
jgi:hypothetical protein